MLHSHLIDIHSRIKQLVDHLIDKILAPHKRRRLKEQSGESDKPSLLHLQRLRFAVLGLTYHKMQLMRRVELTVLLALTLHVLCKEHTVRKMSAKVEHIVKLPLSLLLV